MGLGQTEAGSLVKTLRPSCIYNDGRKHGNGRKEFVKGG